SSPTPRGDDKARTAQGVRPANGGAMRRMTAAVGTALTWCLIAAGPSTAQARNPVSSETPGFCDPPCGPVLCLEQLARMSWHDLEQLYRQAEPGCIPLGYARGRAIHCPDEHLSGVKSRVTRLLWHGKIFRGDDCTLINQWCGFRAIKAKV